MAPIVRVSIAYLAYFSAVGAASPYLFLYYSHLGLGLSEIGGLAALSAAIGLLASPAWGALADHFSETRLTLPLAAVVAIGGALILATGHDLAQIGAGVVVLSVGLGGLGPILDARAIETLGPDRILYGRIRALGSAAFVVAAWAVGVLIDLRDVSALFLAYVPALLITAVVSVSLVRRPAVRSVGIVHGAVGLVRAPTMRLFLLGAFLVWTALVAANAFISIRMEAVGGAAATVGLIWAIGAAVEVPVMWWFARLARRFGVGRLLVTGALLFSVRAGLAALAGDPLTLLATAPFAGVAMGLFYVGAVNLVAERAPGGLAATAQGLFSAVLGLATIVGSATGGLIAGALSIPGLFGICAAGGLVASVVVAVAVGRSRRPVQVAAGQVSI
jgi:MFS transporter, PPP family, 3-phenylpropionic acid transporter